MVLLYWILFITIIGWAFKDCKKVIIFWMPMQLLFNDMVALKFSPPILTLSIAINFILPVLFFFKYGIKKNYPNLNNETFFFKPLFILYAISFTLSILFSIAPFANVINATLKFFIRNFVMLYLFQKCLNNKKDLILFTKSVVVVGVLISTLGLIESIIKDNPIQNFVFFSAPNPGSSIYEGRVWYIPPSIRGEMAMRYGMVRAYSFFNIPIAFGISCLLLGAYLSILIKNRYYILPKKILYISVILLVTGIFTANSKTGMIGLIVILFAFFKFKTILNIKIIFGIVLLFSILFFYFPEYINNYLSLIDSNAALDGGGSTIQGRQEQFKVAIKLFEINPLLGNGYGSIATFLKAGSADGILGAESSWMQILPERGILGALVYLYWYVYTYMHAKKDIPHKIIFFLLASLFIMETATGILDMALYSSIIIAIRRFYIIELM